MRNADISGIVLAHTTCAIRYSRSNHYLATALYIIHIGRTFIRFAESIPEHQRGSDEEEGDEEGVEEEPDRGPNGDGGWLCEYP